MSTQDADDVDEPDVSAVAALHDLAHGLPLDERCSAVLTGYPDAGVEAGLRLQLDVLDRWRDQGERLGGWKIGFTSRGGRDSVGPGVRPFGHLLASRIFRTGTVFPAERVVGLRLEPEICLTMGEPLAGPDLTRDTARRAVSALAPAFELCRRRLPSPVTSAIQIGDDLGQWGVVVGAEVDPYVDLEALTVELCRDGELVDSRPAGWEVVDDPFVSLIRVCRLLDVFGLGLEPGQRVITGSLLAASPIGDGTAWSARLGSLGEVALGVAG